MKIEPGKLYRTRGNQKARIYAVDGGGNYPVQGAVLGLGKIGWICITWNLDGNCQLNIENDYDLIEEWTEPKKTKELWLWVFYHEVDERYYLDRNWRDETEAKTWAEYNNLKLVGKAPFCKEPLVVEE